MSTTDPEPAAPKPGRPSFQYSLWTLLGVLALALAISLLFGDILAEWFVDFVRFVGKILR